MTMMIPPGVLQQGGGAAPAYDPGMMTFDGSTGYYSKLGVTTSGDSVALVLRVNRASFTGGGSEYLARITGPASEFRGVVICYSNDYATVGRRDKILVATQNSAGTNICRFVSSATICDGADHVIVYSFNGTTGSGILYVDGMDSDDTGSADRIAPTTGTLDSGSSDFYFGANVGPDKYLTGDMGYLGYHDTHLTSPTDFYHPTNGLQELDESGWTEWGSQPLLWNQFGTMTDNKGSAGNMTKNGTITGPA